jgi:hypothetical protein
VARQPPGLRQRLFGSALDASLIRPMTIGRAAAEKNVALHNRIVELAAKSQRSLAHFLGLGKLIQAHTKVDLVGQQVGNQRLLRER